MRRGIGRDLVAAVAARQVQRVRDARQPLSSTSATAAAARAWCAVPARQRSVGAISCPLGSGARARRSGRGRSVGSGRRRAELAAEPRRVQQRGVQLPLIARTARPAHPGRAIRGRGARRDGPTAPRRPRGLRRFRGRGHRDRSPAAPASAPPRHRIQPSRMRRTPRRTVIVSLPPCPRRGASEPGGSVEFTVRSATYLPVVATLRVRQPRRCAGSGEKVARAGLGGAVVLGRGEVDGPGAVGDAHEVAGLAFRCPSAPSGFCSRRVTVRGGCRHLHVSRS